ncbi:(deoxy)nucleoside triphosphate pyrophosphohydrolase [Hoeflea sp. G2-23]|uniref:8-oxo-dGTP diphosphatase n=1 Tax=Hoeflea algicola TaxID=2983763 RepID=A0ABT3ZA42_9HYPH|nr:(deoxy)nucleoside triphosphate pyrophosphohydrolase [Hoeflea algicola]MCY0148662.1 (deoxy)nucleoside triphosphate pyrophosphohydrolase [Hoeflea algicola]
MTGKKMLLVVACALVDADGRVLLSQRPKGKKLAGLWEFPGGKVEPGETPEAALIRELMEELGVATKTDCLAPLTFASHSYDEFHLLMPLFVCRRFEGSARGLEGQVLKWVRPRDMRTYPMPPADEPLIPYLIDLL